MLTFWAIPFWPHSSPNLRALRQPRARTSNETATCDVVPSDVFLALAQAWTPQIKMCFVSYWLVLFVSLDMSLTTSCRGLLSFHFYGTFWTAWVVLVVWQYFFSSQHIRGEAGKNSLRKRTYTSVQTWSTLLWRFSHMGISERHHFPEQSKIDTKKTSHTNTQHYINMSWLVPVNT